jgi:predicted HD phosphohydrolase
MPASFKHIAASTAADWAAITAASADRRYREYRNALWLLESLTCITDGFVVDQYQHSLICATRALRAGASEELIVAALFHDIGKPLSVVNHPAIAAAMLGEYVSEDVRMAILMHGEFVADQTHGTCEAERFRGELWYDDARILADWDAASFDPEYPSEPLETFVPLMRHLYRLDDASPENPD